MTKFENVTVVKAANVYFEGRVTSRTILSGEIEVMLPGASQWQPIKGGEAFEVPPSSTFTVRVKTLTDYCGSFLA